MTLQGTIVIDLMGLALMGLILGALRRQTLYVGYAVIWLLSIAGLMVLVSVPPVLSLVTVAVGALFPVPALSLLAFAFIFMILIYLSVQISLLSVRLTEVARYVARRELESRGAVGSPPPPDGADAIPPHAST